MFEQLSIKTKTIMLAILFLVLVIIFLITSSFNSRFEPEQNNPLQSSQSSSQDLDYLQLIEDSDSNFSQTYAQYEKDLGQGYTQKIALVGDLVAQKDKLNQDAQFNISILESLYPDSFTLYVQDQKGNIFIADKPINKIAVGANYWSYVALEKAYISKPEFKNVEEVDLGEVAVLNSFIDETTAYYLNAYLADEVGSEQEPILTDKYEIVKIDLTEGGSSIQTAEPIFVPVTINITAETDDTNEFLPVTGINEELQEVLGQINPLNETDTETFDGLPLHLPQSSEINQRYLGGGKFMIEISYITKRYYIYDINTTGFLEVYKTKPLDQDVLSSYSCDQDQCVIIDGTQNVFIKVDLKSQLASQTGTFDKDLNLFDIYEYINQTGLEMSDLLKLEDEKVLFWDSKEWIQLN